VGKCRGGSGFLVRAECFLSATLQKVSRSFAVKRFSHTLTLSLTIPCEILAAVLELHHGTSMGKVRPDNGSMRAASATETTDFAT